MSEEISFYEANDKHIDDIYKGLIDLLSEAFKYKEIPSKEDVEKILDIRYMQNVHTIIMEKEGRIIGTAGVIFETKLSGRKAAFIEDVAIIKDLRGFGYGLQLMKYVTDFCENKDCYRATLFCNESNKKFYLKCGFRHTCNLMRIDLNEEIPIAHV